MYNMQHAIMHHGSIQHAPPPDLTTVPPVLPPAALLPFNLRDEPFCLQIPPPHETNPA